MVTTGRWVDAVVSMAWLMIVTLEECADTSTLSGVNNARHRRDGYVPNAPHSCGATARAVSTSPHSRPNRMHGDVSGDAKSPHTNTFVGRPWF